MDPPKASCKLVAVIDKGLVVRLHDLCVIDFQDSLFDTTHLNNTVTSDNLSD